jgi:hypothetical protein
MSVKKKSLPMCACRVKYLGKNGIESDILSASRQLKVGKTYYVYRIDIGGWETRLSLRGYPNDFNSVCFEPVDWIK